MSQVSASKSAWEDNIRSSADYVRTKASVKPDIGMILGSGLGSLGNEVEGVKIPYGEIPNFPVSTVEGHAGEFCIGKLAGRNVAVMSGRFHFYEGYSQQQITFPVRVMKELGCSSLIVTNAAGGINTNFDVGDLMLISDHINFHGANPLFGPNVASHGPRFSDMSTAYDADYRAMARSVAKDLGITLREGVYVASTGPSYETAAEIRMYRIWGGDAAGMSTVPEVIVARHAGIRVLGITCITNMAAGILPQPLSHEEVIETTNRVKQSFRKFVLGVLERM
ncbi:MAG: purine-nucleoside phosphorylase [Candidatus Hydrogenedentota bacterium]